MAPHFVIISLCLYALAAAQDTTPDVRVPPSIVEEKIACGSTTSQDPLCMYRSDGTVQITCVATGTPKAEYKWYKNGQILDLSVSNIVMTGPGGSITISPATSLDEGYYQCRAHNPYGTALGKSYKLVKATLGSYPPNLPTQEYTVSPGDALQLACQFIKSVPEAVYSWAIAIDRIDENPRTLDTSNRINTDPQGNLYFSRIESTDDMQGKLYKCNVFNPLLDITTGGSYSKINILNPGPPANRPPAGKFQTPSPHIALVDQDMTLKCLFAGSPPPSISWVRREGQLPAGRYEVKSYNTELKVTKIRESDEGMYECQASNQVGKSQQDVFVKVEAVPKFQTATLEVRPLNRNATEGEDVSFNCKPYAIPMASVEWLMNGEAINSASPPERISISDDSQTLTISNLCKDCTGERNSDLMVIQCNASNVHGYAFGDGYLNVLMATVLMTTPPPQAQVEPNTQIELPCVAKSDDSTPVLYSWYFDDQKLILNPPYTNMNVDNTLIINTEGLEGEDWKQYAGKYTCKASNGYSTVAADSLVELPPGEEPVTGAGIGSMWWIFVIIAVILLLLILLLICCLCLQRNKGDSYPVDEKERNNGNDPEKELADSGYQDYQRPEDEPTKGSRASLSSTIKMDSDEEGSLAEYGDIDTGKFNEDGSFIGQYMEKNKRPADTTV